MIRPSYLKRLDGRNQTAALKQQILFGLAIGWMLVLLGGLRYLFVPDASDSLWLAVLWIGVILLALTLIVPSVLAWPEKLWMKLAHIIGTGIFSIILMVVYFTFFLPVGYFLKWRHGCHPFYQWTDGQAVDAEGWKRKNLRAETIEQSGRKRPILIQPLILISHFVRQGHYVFIPALILLLLLGLILFFAQSSVLAPFIYTIF